LTRGGNQVGEAVCMEGDGTSCRPSKFTGLADHLPVTYLSK
jgi:hypothetical protein